MPRGVYSETGSQRKSRIEKGAVPLCEEGRKVFCLSPEKEIEEVTMAGRK